MPLTLGHLIDAVPNSSAADIAELQALREKHPEALNSSLDDLCVAIELPVEAVVHEAMDSVEHVASKIAHWGGDLIASLEEHLKGHPNRNPDPKPAPCPDCGYGPGNPRPTGDETAKAVERVSAPVAEPETAAEPAPTESAQPSQPEAAE